MLGEAMPGRVVPLAKWKPTNSWDREFLRLPDDPNGEGELYTATDASSIQLILTHNAFTCFLE